MHNFILQQVSLCIISYYNKFLYSVPFFLSMSQCINIINNHAHAKQNATCKELKLITSQMHTLYYSNQHLIIVSRIVIITFYMSHFARQPIGKYTCYQQVKYQQAKWQASVKARWRAYIERGILYISRSFSIIKTLSSLDSQVKMFETIIILMFFSYIKEIPWSVLLFFTSTLTI